MNTKERKTLSDFERLWILNFLLNTLTPLWTTEFANRVIKYMPTAEEDEDNSQFDKYCGILSLFSKLEKEVDEEKSCEYLKKAIDQAKEFWPPFMYQIFEDKYNTFCKE